MKAKKLSPKEYESLLKSMRQWLPHQRDEVAKLVWHIAALNEEIKALLSAQQPNMFEVKQGPVIKTQYQEFKPKLDNSQKVPLARRLQLMIEANETESLEWKQTLKWNGLTHEKALAIGSGKEEKTSG